MAGTFHDGNSERVGIKAKLQRPRRLEAALRLQMPGLVRSPWLGGPWDSRPPRPDACMAASCHLPWGLSCLLPCLLLLLPLFLLLLFLPVFLFLFLLLLPNFLLPLLLLLLLLLLLPLFLLLLLRSVTPCAQGAQGKGQSHRRGGREALRGEGRFAVHEHEVKALHVPSVSP